MFCPKCGVLAQDGALFCHNCGADLKKISAEEAPLSADIENVRKYAAMRKATDEFVSPWWIIVPAVTVLTYLGTSFYNVFSFFRLFAAPALTSAAPSPLPGLGFLNFGPLTLVTLLPEIVFLYLFYTLIKRRNLHFARQNRLFRSLNAALRKIARAKGAIEVERYSSYIESSLSSSTVLDREKSAAFWAILLIVPVVQIFALAYILYFLNEDFFVHEQRENYDLSVFGYELQLMGFSFTYKRQNSVSSRSYALYLILTIITLGLFSIYWDYILIKDPNGHFADQYKIEDALLEGVMPLFVV
jgi:hypothetical protein